MAEFLTCCSCGIAFGVPDHWLKCRREDKADFYCPNGHPQAFVESTADKLRRERDRLQQQLAQRDDEMKALENRRRAAVGQVTKLRNRVGHGVCPCCNRSFENLARHMTSQHPHFAAQAAE